MLLFGFKITTVKSLSKFKIVAVSVGDPVDLAFQVNVTTFRPKTMFARQILMFIMVVQKFHTVTSDRNFSYEFDTWLKDTVLQYGTRNVPWKTNCSTDLAKLLELMDANNSHYSSRHFFESWIKTSSMDLWTLDIFEIMSSHIKCNLDRPNTTKLWEHNRYCTYEIPEQKLKHGLLLGYCIPYSCSDRDATNLGRFIAAKSIENATEKYKKEQITCNDNYENGGDDKATGWEFYTTLIVTLVAVILSVIGTLLDCPR